MGHFYFKNRIRIESARVRGSGKDDVEKLKMAKDSAAGLSWAGHSTRREHLKEHSTFFGNWLILRLP